MAPLTSSRRTQRRTSDLFGFPVKAATTIQLGALVVLAAGLAVPASTALNLVPVGVAKSYLDNSAGADGDQTVEVETGTFAFINNATSINLTHVGSPAYMVDDQTVDATDGTGTRSPVGIIMDVNDAGVWVKI